MFTIENRRGEIMRDKDGSICLFTSRIRAQACIDYMVCHFNAKGFKVVEARIAPHEDVWQPY